MPDEFYFVWQEDQSPGKSLRRMLRRSLKDVKMAIPVAHLTAFVERHRPGRHAMAPSSVQSPWVEKSVLKKFFGFLKISKKLLLC